MNTNSNAPRIYSSRPEVQASYASAFNEAVLSERSRLVGIMSLPEAQGREAMRDNLMFNTDLSVEKARTILAAVPKAQVQVRNLFAEAMANIPNPPTQPDAAYRDDDISPEAAQAMVNAMMSIHKRGADETKK
ncbi:MAG: hypothetical protein PHW25_00485 [Zoogloea sp.]|uniref:hypothetical protein n=1 Tax=Zoogloea sp. TaxID=49181 RepID=UPI002620D0F7|nr:hypothetical protein [Zoogloea sp.]MDD3325545.1 hypothetical protein [Zoogloea sp.]